MTVGCVREPPKRRKCPLVPSSFQYEETPSLDWTKFTPFRYSVPARVCRRMHQIASSHTSPQGTRAILHDYMLSIFATISTKAIQRAQHQFGHFPGRARPWMHRPYIGVPGPQHPSLAAQRPVVLNIPNYKHACTQQSLPPSCACRPGPNILQGQPTLLIPSCLSTPCIG